MKEIVLSIKSYNGSWIIKTKLKKHTDYQTFIAPDSGENIPSGYQKNPYHIVCDVKYDLRDKARVVTGGNWTVNDKEDICCEKWLFLRRTMWPFMLCM